MAHRIDWESLILCESGVVLVMTRICTRAWYYRYSSSSEELPFAFGSWHVHLPIHNSVNQHESAALHAESVLLLLPINSKTNDFFHTNSGFACVLYVESTTTSLDHWYIYLWNTKVVRQTVLSLSFVRRLSRRGRGCLIFEKWCVIAISKQQTGRNHTGTTRNMRKEQT